MGTKAEPWAQRAKKSLKSLKCRRFALVSTEVTIIVHIRCQCKVWAKLRHFPGIIWHPIRTISWQGVKLKISYFEWLCIFLCGPWLPYQLSEPNESWEVRIRRVVENADERQNSWNNFQRLAVFLSCKFVQNAYGGSNQKYFWKSTFERETNITLVFGQFSKTKSLEKYLREYNIFSKKGSYFTGSVFTVLNRPKFWYKMLKFQYHYWIKTAIISNGCLNFYLWTKHEKRTFLKL